jgi:hypothetical protein
MKDKTVSPEAKEKAENSRRLWSFLARIRFQAFFVRDNQLVLQADLDND